MYLEKLNTILKEIENSRDACHKCDNYECLESDNNLICASVLYEVARKLDKATIPLKQGKIPLSVMIERLDKCDCLTDWEEGRLSKVIALVKISSDIPNSLIDQIDTIYRRYAEEGDR